MLVLTTLVIKSESVRNIIRERRMLEHLDHPFLCNLRYSFQDIEYMCVTSGPLFVSRGADLVKLHRGRFDERR